MSVNYATGLSDYDDKGVCGLPEIQEEEDVLRQKVLQLADFIRSSKKCVVFCGAGLSTAAGIPDFRGKEGVWTLEKQGLSLPASKLQSFDRCQPTFSHMAIRSLLSRGHVSFIVSQNIDGLFLKANFPRSSIAELHGNYFVDECTNCRRRFIRTRPSPTMCCKPTGDACPRTLKRPCKGHLTDTILDWEQNLPDKELDSAIAHSKKADLAICLGTTLQINPAGKLPLNVLKKGRQNRKRKHDQINSDTANASTPKPGKLVIVNLQKTKHDAKANLIIHGKIDRVMELLCAELGIQVPSYDSSEDPTKKTDLVEWV